VITPLCSLARNPDGSFVQPTAYEINDAISSKLAFAALGLAMVGFVLAIIHHRLRRRKSGLGLALAGAAIMLLHPRWTVSTSGGDCGLLRVECSWLVLFLLGGFLGIHLVLLVWPAKERDGPDRLDYDDHLPSQVPRQPRHLQFPHAL